MNCFEYSFNNTYTMYSKSKTCQDVIYLHYITEKQELEASYKGLCKVSSEVWPEVLSRLSVRGEWMAIRYLILGIDFQYINGTCCSMWKVGFLIMPNIL